MVDKKKIAIGFLCTLILMMAIGYALLAQRLSITGTSSITSNWQVEITNIREKEKSVGATTNSTNYTSTTASFNTSLTSPGDYATYEVTVTNKGTLDAVLESINISKQNNPSIMYKKTGLRAGDKLVKNNGTNIIEITVSYNPSTTAQPEIVTNNLELVLNYQQDLGQTIYEYKLGDIVSFAGSDWRVIENSESSQSYVVLLKDKVLTAEEIGEQYAYKSIYVCTSADVDNEYVFKNTKCTEVNQVIIDEVTNRMAYNWSIRCHLKGMQGNVTYINSYTDTIRSSCYSGYANNEIEKFLEGSYIYTLGENNLIEIDNYKIRLITIDELVNNFGYVRRGYGGWYGAPIGTPKWLYDGSLFGGSSYWTMSIWSNVRPVSYVYRGYASGADATWVYDTSCIRPVINLLKSSLE